MIQREYYMKQIRPFINTDLIKVLTGIRRSGKSVMLQLIQEELLSQQVRPDQMISLNFEDLANLPLCQPMALYQWIADKAAAIKGKIYIFLDEIQEVTNWERVINSCVSLSMSIFILPVQMLSCFLGTFHLFSKPLCSIRHLSFFLSRIYISKSIRRYPASLPKIPTLRRDAFLNESPFPRRPISSVFAGYVQFRNFKGYCPTE